MSSLSLALSISKDTVRPHASLEESSNLLLIENLLRTAH